MIRALLVVAVLANLLAGCAASPLSRGRIEAIVADPQRSAADRTNDVRRKPADMLAFVGIAPGMRALDVSAGGGYTAELLARAVGPSGKVYAQSAKPSARLLERVKNVPNIAVVARPLEDPAPAEVHDLDLVTLMFNYHDLGHLGVDRAKLNRAVFRALKAGGMYVVADHAGRPGTGISESGTLHRIEEAFLRSEVEAAGFRLAGEGAFLRNPADPRNRETPDPPQPKDEFVLKFVKP
jgi:predicted methyltransferase